ncbi:uncharacterized protein LOC141660781 [Apium graveolens]|uniref:uncharacterized protein LOC141660781 n=1 Tax=Apium graveolens TaxID=4045 RepID=UPI003D79B857
MKLRHVDVNCDSLLISNHVNGSYEAKDPKMIMYLDVTKRLMSCFDTFNIQHVPRKNNVQADALVGLGAIFKGLSLNNIPVVHIMKPTVEILAHEMEVLALNRHGDNADEVIDSWIQTYKDYLQHRIRINNNNEARTLRMKMISFTVLDDEFLKNSSTGLLQRCLKIMRLKWF